MTEGVGERFQNETKYIRDKMPRGFLDLGAQPKLYKKYPDAKKIKLSDPVPPKKTDLTEIIQNRKSERDFSDTPISENELSYLLWASTGIARKEHGCQFRTAPSAGALYPIETYLIVNNVDTVEQGAYHYAIDSHVLEELKCGDLRQEITNAALEQGMCAEAAVVFVWTAIFNRSKWKYGQRAYRYVYLDAGHIAAQLSLAAVTLGLGSCQVAALFDNEINNLIGVDGQEESVLYMSVIGHPFYR
ncbi:MAG: SagB/ThcOx family dehydrogenase [Candidatus Omnitrophota bacterium]